ncbi:MAG TPA: HNH endonuclease [Nitrososphaeraceae archaeon]|nr:HNH endonuclease [Nitrososphaeraceae archaeon]
MKSIEYQVLRYQVLKRDNYTCQYCKKHFETLDVHHIIPYRKGGPDTLDNLVSLCPTCHKIIEPATAKGYKRSKK